MTEIEQLYHILQVPDGESITVHAKRLMIELRGLRHRTQPPREDMGRLPERRGDPGHPDNEMGM